MVQVDNVSPVQEVRGQRAPKTGFRPAIEGLCAVAVLAVVLFHADMPSVGDGFIGVDVLFVIAGFLITGMLWREVTTTGGVRLSGCYWVPARRLLAASATIGMPTAIASAILLSPLEICDVLKDAIACVLYVGNYRFAQQGIDYLASDRPPSPFHHCWSLGIEEQFHLVWPPLIVAVASLIRRARRPTGGKYAATSTSPSLVVLAHAESLTPTRSSSPAATSLMGSRGQWRALRWWGSAARRSVRHWRKCPARNGGP